MLKLIVGDEGFDQDRSVFVVMDPVTLELEHSLASLSKWESKHKIPFLSSEKSSEQLLDYVKFMCLTPDVPPEVFEKLSEGNVAEINAYLADTMTATWFGKEPDDKPSRKIITSEVIYYWMVVLQIDWRAEEWHLNRLLTLIRVINAENAPKKKVRGSGSAQDQRALNAQRRAQAGHAG